MRRRISFLVAATTSAVILAFLIPLGLLVRTLAEDRAIAGASQEAQAVATLVAGVNDESQLTDLVGLVDQRSRRATSVLLPDGTLIGTAPPGSRQWNAAAVSRARAGEAFTLMRVTRTRRSSCQSSRSVARSWCVRRSTATTCVRG